MYDEVERLKEEEREPESGERAARTRPEKRSSGLVIGLVLIVLGFVFLVENLFGFSLFENWWALFILIPAVHSLSDGWRKYQATGSWGGSASGSLVWGLALTGLALIFLFGLDIGNLWPLFLILIGLSLLLKGR
jgi:hypothetical protein